MKVVISDKFAKKGLEVFAKHPDIELDYCPGLSPEELTPKLADAEGWIVRSATKATAPLITAGPKLKAIGRAGIGVDNIDSAAATAAGILVMNTPGENAVTTAEHSIAMLMAAARRIPQACASLKSGKWEKNKFTGVELRGKTLGVLGLGNVGSVVARCGLALGMKVIANDPFVTADRAESMGVELSEFDDLLARSDFLTIHAPKTKNTIGLFNRETFSKMKTGAVLINCARGVIVDEEALLEALRSGKLSAAALDVFAQEPVTSHPLFELENVVVTPHLGASTIEAQDAVCVAVAEQIIAFLKHGIITNAVNAPSLSADIREKAEPSLRLAEKLGKFQGQLLDRPVEEIHVLYAGDIASLPLKLLTMTALQGIAARLTDRFVNIVNVQDVMKEKGIRLIENTTDRMDEYANLIGITVRFADGASRMIHGVLAESREIRIVRIDSWQTSAEADGHLLIIQNRDVPGVVGAVGNLLGSKGVNIANLRLSRDRKKAEALMMVNIDDPVNEEILAQLRGLPNILTVHLVEL